MRKVDGMAVLKAAKEHSPRTVVLVVTAFASTETAVEAMKLGAYDYITKPFKLDELKLTVANALERRRLQEENLALKRQLRREQRLRELRGRAARKILDVFETIRKMADSGSTVMITGESGTGKELVAQAMHYESSRRGGPFVSVNCGAVPENLMESELFGHVKGAFTGAVAEHGGPVRGGRRRHAVPRRDHRDPAHGPGEAAARDPGARRSAGSGDTRDVKIDVRLIAASNRDLGRAVADGVLREDLFYRLNVIPIHLPPLRERREDIPLLVAHFIQKLRTRWAGRSAAWRPDALAVLEHYHWPGNIRELENVIERAIVLGLGEMLDVDALPGAAAPAARSPGRLGRAASRGPRPGGDPRRIEHRYMQMALDRMGGVQTRAAELLRVSFRQFRYKLQKFQQREPPREG